MDAYFANGRQLPETRTDVCTAETTSKRVAGARLPRKPHGPDYAKPRLTKPVRDPMNRFPLRRAAYDRRGVAERLKAADCKSADVRLRRFESYPLHQRSGDRGRIDGLVQGLGRAIQAGVAQW